MNQALAYSLKVWITNSLVWPIIFLIATVFLYKYNPLHLKFIGWYFSSVCLALLLTIIPWVVVYFSLKAMYKRGWPLVKLKITILIEVECLLLIIVPIGYWVNHEDTLTEILYWATCAIATAFCFWLYKLKPNGTTISTHSKA